jgi:hypothetical protein
MLKAMIGSFIKPYFYQAFPKRHKMKVKIMTDDKTLGVRLYDEGFIEKDEV